MKGMTWHMLWLALLLAGCGKPQPSDRYVYPDKILDFSKLYPKHCAGCHGETGRLGVAPPLRDVVFLTIVSEADLRNIITHGRAGTPMSAFARSEGGDLTDQQIDVLAKGIMSNWSDKKSIDPPWPSYRQGKEEVGDQAAGAKVFARSCATCHGENGAGGEKAGALNDRAFLDLISDQALRRLVITGRPDLGMPNFAGMEPPLTAKDIADVTALMAAWRQKAQYQFKGLTKN